MVSPALAYKAANWAKHLGGERAMNRPFSQMTDAELKQGKGLRFLNPHRSEIKGKQHEHP
jgi:hypothetical protein